MILALQQLYTFQETHTAWEVLRAWLNGEPLPGLRFSPWWSNVLMLITALVFVFLLELLLTVGIQIWERRVLGRMQSRWGPQEYGGISTKAFRRILIPILILLALPALFYGIQYWCGYGFTMPPVKRLLVAAWIALAIYLVHFISALTAAVMRESVTTLRGLIARKLRQFGPSLRATVWLIDAVMLAALLSIVFEYLPKVDFGSFVPYLTVACTFTAFGVYLVYMFGWYWRQGLFDTIKLFFKEDVVPLNADRFLFLVAPMLVYLPALLSWVVLPFGVAALGGHYLYYVVQDLNIGLLLIIVDFSLVFVAIIMSGYASNNKYALMGAMREAAELLSYEVPMLMSLLCVALFAGSLNLTEIVQRQSMTWGILPLFPAFIILLVTAIAETNRPPFDLPEASNELLGGFVVEYSGFRFALFYVAEYANVFLVSAEIVVCFLGGWKGPMFLGLDGLWLTSLFWFLAKTYALVFLFIWVRATMPRIRIDQIMFFCWKFLVPASVVVLGITAMGVTFRHPWFSANRLWSEEQFKYVTVSTSEALSMMTLHERAFFWCYNFFAVAAGVFIVALAWRILWGQRRHPLPRREVSWE